MAYIVLSLYLLYGVLLLIAYATAIPLLIYAIVKLVKLIIVLTK